MNLIIFDIDGTLTNSQVTEDHCFKTAFLEVLEIDIFDQEWKYFVNVTDWGITKEIYHKVHQQDIPSEKLEQFKKRFVELLATSCASDKSVFREVSGANTFFHHLKNNNYAVAIATGSWRDSACIKLDAIDINPQNLPFSHSDLFISREEILLDAIEQSRKIYETSFDSIHYFGDGEWDFKTCKKLNIPFVGVDCTDTGKLKNLGSEFIIKDFMNPKGILEYLHKMKGNKTLWLNSDEE